MNVMRIVTGAASAAALTLGIFAGMSAARAEGEITMLVWEGYADDSFVKPFEAKTGCHVNATYTGSNDEMVAKVMNADGTVDLITPSNDSTQLLIAAGKVAAVDPAKYPGVAEYYDAFKAPHWLQADGKQWGIPFGYGFARIVIDANVIPNPPHTLATLWDPRLKGKLAMNDDLETLYEAARLLGIKNVYDMTDDELKLVRDKLIELKPNIRKLWVITSEWVDMFNQGEIAGGNVFEYAIAKLWKDGKTNLVDLRPKEGMGGYSDSWMVAKGSEANPCVGEWLAWVTTAEAQAAAAKATGIAFSNQKSFALLDADTQAFQEKLGISDPEVLNHTDWWQPVKRRAKYLEVWNEVKAASAP